MTTQTPAGEGQPFPPPAGVDPERWAAAVARFLANHVVDPQTGCWVGREKPTGDGYIRVKLCGRRWLAHRLAYALRHGPIPDGLNVLHGCDNRLCRNLDHLRVGTQRDNLQDAKERRRLPIGPGSRPRKLSGRDALTVFGMRMGPHTVPQIAEEFGVSVRTVRQVLRGRAWGDAIGAEVDAALAAEAEARAGAAPETAAETTQAGAGQPDRPSRPTGATGGR